MPYIRVPIETEYYGSASTMDQRIPLPFALDLEQVASSGQQVPLSKRPSLCASSSAVPSQNKAAIRALACLAFYPSEPCLVKMLTQAGFPFVYQFVKLPNPATVTPGLWSFDNPETRRFTEDRIEFIVPLLRELNAR